MVVIQGPLIVGGSCTGTNPTSGTKTRASDCGDALDLAERRAERATSRSTDQVTERRTENGEPRTECTALIEATTSERLMNGMMAIETH